MPFALGVVVPLPTKKSASLPFVRDVWKMARQAFVLAVGYSRSSTSEYWLMYVPPPLPGALVCTTKPSLDRHAGNFITDATEPPILGMPKKVVVPNWVLEAVVLP